MWRVAGGATPGGGRWLGPGTLLGAGHMCVWGRPRSVVLSACGVSSTPEIPAIVLEAEEPSAARPRDPPVEVFSTTEVPGTSTLDLEQGTVAYAVRESLLLLREGKMDAWVADWCHSDACGAPNAVESLKTFGLQRAVGNAAECLHGDDARVQVLTTEGDPAAEGPVKVFIRCGDRMPVPSVHRQVDGRWKVTEFSW